MQSAKDELVLSSFGIAGYRSVRELQLIGPLAKISVVAGRNNSGKSNLLRFAKEHFSETVSQLRHGHAKAFSWADGPSAPLGAGGETAAFATCVSLDDQALLSRLSKLRRSPPRPPQTLGDEGAQDLLALVGRVTRGRDDVYWHVWRRRQRGQNPESPNPVADLQQAFEGVGDLERFKPYLTPDPAQVLAGHLKPEVPAPLAEEPVFIPAFRAIRPSDGEQRWDGTGLIQLLADLRDPDLGPERGDKQRRWHEFERFVQDVLESPDASIRVPANAKRLVVTIEGRELDIEDLGTGVHELVILAAAATAHRGRLFLVEEPEIHLHPILQRRLLRYLDASTENQYLIATHSAHFLDHPGAAVFRVGLDDGWTTVSPAHTNTGRVRTSRELGYKPSDLLQANAVVWVEGPSDRIYVRHWLSQVDPELREGIDYAIMFYGGRLAAHLSGDDPPFGLEVGELIELRRLNRFSGIVMDSDRKKKGGQTNATKRRLQSEFERDGGFAWVTRPREIENYIPPETMLQGLKLIDPKANTLVDDSDYEPRWKYRRRGSPKHHSANKVELAKAVTSLSPPMNMFDLKRQMRAMAVMIREASRD